MEDGVKMEDGAKMEDAAKMEDGMEMTDTRLDVIPRTGLNDNIFFFKRIVDGNPRLDVLVQVGEGTLRPMEDEVENGLWQVTDDLYVFRQTGPLFRVLQSEGAAVYSRGTMTASKAKFSFALKTGGFLAARDADGALHPLKVSISGNAFGVHPSADRRMVLHRPKWRQIIKETAKLLAVNLKTMYDGAGRTATAKDVGNWSAGHCEKRLSIFAVFALMDQYGIVRGKTVTRHDFTRLKAIINKNGLQPHFEIHLTRAPCGTGRRPGTCVQFVKRLGFATGIKFSIHSWEKNVILDSTVPPRPPPRAADKDAHQLQVDANEDDDDGEEVDLEFYLSEQYDNNWRGVVFNQFEEVVNDVEPQAAVQNPDAIDLEGDEPLPQMEVSPASVSNFREHIQKQFARPKRIREDVPKPYPPTPASPEDIASVYFEDVSLTQAP